METGEAPFVFLAWFFGVLFGARARIHHVDFQWRFAARGGAESGLDTRAIAFDLLPPAASVVAARQCSLPFA